MSLGRIHSIESMGLVDGPGIRAVVFMQGCHLRCRYCHNPDTWPEEDGGNLLLSPEEVLNRLLRFKPYFGTNGGVTFSGGEPLLQSDFLGEMLALCHKAGIHTCLDTAGCGSGGYERILANTDLLLYDVKHYTEAGYRAVTGCSPEETLRFLAAAQEMQIPLWIRHVVVPGLTDGDGHLAGLETYLKTLHGIERVELLPYHTLGVSKYHALGIPYSLEDIPPVSETSLEEWNKRLNKNCCHTE